MKLILSIAAGFFIVMALYACGSSVTPAGFTIKGNVDRKKDALKIYLVYANDSGVTITDSTVISNGIFEFRGKVAGPLPANLVLGQPGMGLDQLTVSNTDFLSFYLANDAIEIDVTDSLKKARIQGSPVNAEALRYELFLKNGMKKQAALQEELSQTLPEKQQSPVFQQEVQQKLITARHETNEVLKQYARSNPSSYFSVSAIATLVQNKADVKEIAPLYQGLEEPLRKSPAGSKLEKTLQTLQRTAVGAIAPVFNQSDASGKYINLSDFKGKYLLLDFWASWCRPCRMENPNLVKAYAKYRSKGFEILGVSLDKIEQKEAWLLAIKQDGLSWTQVSDLNGPLNEAAQLYGVNAIPQNFLISPEGEIIASNLRGSALDQKLQELFKE
ncbi:redoxin domain-containing protein [Niabella sp. CJ426]|uniref:redoxin domain-containing protein n=1 Tax=Niabella sp. CJ426 TaxID=3393740 RepID=UPI003D07EC8D